MTNAFILKKISANERIYFFTGTLHLSTNDDGGNVLQVETGLFADDAHRFPSFDGADEWANLLNQHGIGGADWKVEHFDHELVTLREAAAPEAGTPILSDHV